MVSMKYYSDIDLRKNRLLNFAVESVSGDLPSEANEGAMVYHSGEGVMYQRLKDGWKVIASGKDLEDALSKVSEDLQALSEDTEEALDTKADKTAMETALGTKQDKLVAGSHISIAADGKTISSTYGVASTTANGLMSKDDKSKLDGIASGAQVNSITGVKGNAESAYRTGNVNITKANIGLGNVDNTSDVNKPISTAVQNALNGKASTSVATQSANGLMSSADKKKLDGVASGAQVNVIETVKVNGTALTPSSKAVNIDLSDYAKKGDVTTVMRYKGSVATVTDLPTTPPPTLGDTYNIIDTNANYTWDGSAWDLIGSPVDLSDYATKTEVNSALGGKVSKSGDVMTGELWIERNYAGMGLNRGTSGNSNFMFNATINDVNTTVMRIRNITDETKNRMQIHFTKPDGSSLMELFSIVNEGTTFYATAPTPSDASDNSTKIATTSWVNQSDLLVHTTGTEDVRGFKKFTNPYWNVGGLAFKDPRYGITSTDKPLFNSAFKYLSQFPLFDMNEAIISNDIVQTNADNSLERVAIMRDSTNTQRTIYSIKLNASDGGVTMLLRTNPPSDANGQQVTTANWCNGKFVKKTGDTMSGELIANGGVRSNFVRKLDSSNNNVGFVMFEETDASNIASLNARKSTGETTAVYPSLKLYANSNATYYATLTSNYIGENDNSDKILTIKMANSLPSLVHTTGNETIAGEKTFTTQVVLNSTNSYPILIKNPDADSTTTDNKENFIYFGDKNQVMMGRVGYANYDIKSFVMSHRWNNKWHSLGFEYKTDGSIKTVAPTTPTDAASNEIVTADWYRMKNLTSLNLGDATHKFKRLARATISGGWQHIISTIETHKFHNTVTAAGGTSLLKIALSTDGSGVIGLVTARWLENEQSMAQFHVLYNSNTVEIWVYNTDSAVLHQYDYWVLRLRECISRTSVDRKSMWDFTSEFADALPEGMTEVEIELPITVTPTDLADNSKKYATTEWVNTASVVVHTISAESIAGLKTFKDPIHLVNDSVSYTQSQAADAWTYLRGVEFRDKASERMGEIRSVRYTNTDGVLVNSTEIIARGKDNVDALLAIVTADNGQKYAYCPSTPSNATNNIIATADWSLGKFVKKAGDTMTGNLSITKADVSTLILKRSDIADDYPTYKRLGVIKGEASNGVSGQIEFLRNTPGGYTGSGVIISAYNPTDVQASIELYSFDEGVNQEAYATCPSPSSKTDNSKKIATTAWVNQSDFLVHSYGNESVAGIKSYNDEICMKSRTEYNDATYQTSSNFTFRQGSQFTGSIKTVHDANNDNAIAIEAKNPTTGKNAVLRVISKADGTSDLRLISDGAWNKIATENWVNNKLAGKVTISTSAPSGGSNGDIWFQYE